MTRCSPNASRHREHRRATERGPRRNAAFSRRGESPARRDPRRADKSRNYAAGERHEDRQTRPHNLWTLALHPVDIGRSTESKPVCTRLTVPTPALPFLVKTASSTFRSRSDGIASGSLVSMPCELLRKEPSRADLRRRTGLPTCAPPGADMVPLSSTACRRPRKPGHGRHRGDPAAEGPLLPHHGHQGLGRDAPGLHRRRGHRHDARRAATSSAAPTSSWRSSRRRSTARSRSTRATCRRSTSPRTRPRRGSGRCTTS